MGMPGDRTKGEESDVSAVEVRAESGNMTNDRGAEIQRRLDRLNLSDRDFERRTGVERKTLRRAIEQGDRTRESTFRNIELALDQLEARLRGEPTATPAAPEARGPNMVTLRRSEGDIDVVVEGPIENIEALAATVERLVAFEVHKRSQSGND